MLCVLCISMFQGPSTLGEDGSWWRKGDHHASFENLTRAADAGCKICKILRRSLNEHGDVNFRGRFSLSFDEYWYSLYLQWGKHRTKVELERQTKLPLHWRAQYLKEAGEDLAEIPWHVPNDEYSHKDISANTGDENVLKLALKWLRLCQSEHSICQQRADLHDSKYLPKRLLDVGDTESPICRLHVAGNKQCTEASGYVALSHCWGVNPSFLTLTSDNLAEFQRGIPFHWLPKTFADAIHACRRLGFKWIWIDSLCIIQSGPGSKEDWQFHAVMMDRIYADCELNLAVARAANAAQGAFVDRDPDFLQDAFIDVREANEISAAKNENSDQATTTCLLRIRSPEDSHSYIWTLPLQQRGWVFQERLLSPRTLYFGRDRIYWECNQGTCNEFCLPLAREINPKSRRAYSLPESVLTPSPTHSTEKDMAFLHEKWYKIVEDYSKTHLTHPSKDKLVALAALAKRYHLAIRREYLAGLFSSDLPLGLMWAGKEAQIHHAVSDSGGWERREYISPDGQRDSVYRAPSWSWASMNGAVFFYPAAGIGAAMMVNFVAAIYSFRVELVDPQNPYGELSMAELTIEGPIAHIESCPRDADGVDVQVDPCVENDQLLILHIGVWNNKLVRAMVLAPNGNNTYRRVGLYEGSLPPEVSYPALKFERATVTIV
ncbi:HET-domain-containing protein [Lophiostoma macrostomum CBS 122681]|uniref:HET-domain-containing protein n=1 Tax=Lophiostoma macrostomum CBS 122681 TaxID=1314788 RepID=A0A6A6SH22_9PLEO|nr:HET-domain-containing protein [Lophiostoma macrostomum CBS 122681]